MPGDWRRAGRPRSHAAPAIEPGDGPGEESSPVDDDTDGAGSGSGAWHSPWPAAGGYAGDGLTGLAHGSAERGPARGYPPAPDQPDPVYPDEDADAWSHPGGSWEDAQRGHPPWDAAGQAAGEGDWDAENNWAADGTAAWPAAPQTGEWAAQGDQRDSGHQAGHWDSDRETGQWDSDRQAGQWAGEHEQWQDDGARWNSTGQWEAEFAQEPAGAQWEAGDGVWPPGGYEDEYPEEPGARDAGDDSRWLAPRRRVRGARGARGGGRAASPLARVAALTRGAAGGSRNRTIILAGAGAVVVAALAVTAYTFLSGNSKNAAGSSTTVTAPKLPTTQPSAAGTSAGAKYGKWQYITSRATDKTPLTLGELFPAQFLINGSSYIRTVDRSDNDCNAGLFGSQLQSAAQSNGCTQVLRASYMSADQKMIGTVGVVNLSTADGATKVGQATGAEDFVTPLAGRTGPTKNMSQGTGVVQAEIKGHYLILSFAEYANLATPSHPSQRSQLESFASDLITGSANIALSTRMVNGHP
jgi:hypothetical protein